jgi:hypothetical protein
LFLSIADLGQVVFLEKNKFFTLPEKTNN